MAAWVDGVLFNPTLGGTTDWVVSTAVQGFMTPAQAGAINGQVYKYRAENADLSQWETGEGTYTVGTTTLTRTTVLYNSSGTGSAAGQSGAGTKINFSTVPQVGIVPSKFDLLSTAEANNFTAAKITQALLNLGSAMLATSQPVIAMCAAGRLNSSEDLNTVITDGHYFAEVGCTNSPVASTQYYLMVQKYPAGSGYVQQTAWDLTATGGAFTRNQAAGSWSPWVPIDGARYKLTTFTRVMSLASASLAITGIGFKPRFVMFTTGISGGATCSSIGYSDVVGNTCLELGSTIFPQAAAGIQREALAGANYNIFNVSSFDADGFTLGVTKVGSPTATMSVGAVCFR